MIVGGDRSDDLEELISVKPSLIVLTGSLTADENVVKKCEEQGISMISTPLILIKHLNKLFKQFLLNMS